jgi:ribosomal protein S18 acetylase RimI-like enzyme
MSISSSVSRGTDYFKRNGLLATLHRAGLAARRALFSSRMVLFYCDLSTLKPTTADLQSLPKVERHTNQIDISPHDLQEITSFWSPKLARRRIKERFELGASLWLIKLEDKLAGYGWTLQGHTVEPHYFCLGPDDIHLFDFQVFPKYRGRGVNPSLVSSILRRLAVECQGRAFIEAAEWNKAQLASLRRTPFRHLGSARKFTLLRRTMVFWHEGKTVEREQGKHLNQASIAATGGESSGIPDLRV